MTETMKKYKVNVNGTDYEIAIELMDGNAKAEELKSAPKAAPEAPKAPAAPAAAGAGEKVTCPMTGNILAVNVNVGDSVKEGQVLMVLEAMKMENEIMAPCSGKITSVGVTKGATVESGALLCTIE